VAARAHVLDVSVIAGQNEQQAGRLAELDHRIEEEVQRLQRLAGVFVVAGVPREIGLEELEEGEVVRARHLDEVLRGLLGRDDGDVVPTLLDQAVARDVVKDRLVRQQILLDGNGFGLGQRHDGGDGFEAAHQQLVHAVHQVRVGETAAQAFAGQLHEQVALVDQLAQGRAGKALAVTAHVLGGVDAGEHGGLSGGALRQTLGVEACIDGNRVVLDQMAQHGAHPGMHRIVFCGRTQSHAINEEK